MKTKVLIVIVVLLVAPAGAQIIHRHTLPAGFENTGGIGPGFYLEPNLIFNSFQSQRWQWVYDYTELYHQCPITIHEIRLRALDPEAAFAATTVFGLEIRMASATANNQAIGPDLVANLGPDVRLVWQGDLQIPPYPYTPGANPPAPWHITIPLQTPFEFDPTRQKDFLIELVTLFSNPTGFVLDWAYPGWFTIVGDPYGYPFGNVLYGYAPIFEMAYTLGATGKFNLQAQSNVQDLLVLYTNVPPTTANGYTLVSLTPALEFARGPFFGIQPDLLTWFVLLAPPAAGDPFHWTWPAPGLFPAVPLYFPSPSMAAYTGLTAEFVGVAVSAIGTLDGVTAPQSVTF